MKEDPLLRSLEKFHGKRLLLDTNLLFEYFTGCFYRVNLEVPRHGAFKEDEFVLLVQIIQHFKEAGRLLTTPHLLTEIWSLSKMLKQNRVAFLSFILPMIQDLDEWFEPKRIGVARLSRCDFFLRFGLADSAIIELTYDPLLMLTNDKSVARYLEDEKRKRNVVHFGDLKELCLGRN
ncbi:MAG TPA: hypothetical protein VN765_09715 [Candidatus Acidoferrum sp.]|nr:hypothetical protein [Candidatus Acidoferrum sp.]